MIVDDDAAMRRIVATTLRFAGWRITEVAGGLEGVELVRAHPSITFDVIVLDAMMPDLDGTGTFVALRQCPSTTRTPIVFLTAHLARSNVDAYLALGACAVIAKPFDPLTLARDIVAALEAATP
jgi:two-component system, OmpR family, response regulator